MKQQCRSRGRRWTAGGLTLLAIAIGSVALPSTASAVGPALTLTTTGALSGGVVTYTFSVKNTGTTALSPVSVAVDSFTGQGAAPDASVCGAQIATLAAGVTTACTVTYTFTVTNTSNVTLASVQPDVFEFSGHPLLDTSSCPSQIGSLAPGVGGVCTATYTVTAADLGAASLHLAAIWFTSGAAFGLGTDPQSLPRTLDVPVTIAPTIAVTKSLATPRARPGDQFTVTITAGGSVVNSTVNSTTQGTGIAVAAGTGTTGTFTATAGTSYVVNEIGNGGTNLTLYTSTIGCTDANGQQGGLPAAGTRFNPLIGVTITPVVGAAISCTIINTANVPSITLIKALGSARAQPSDQFQVSVSLLPIDANATTQGSGSVVTAGTGQVGPSAAVAGTSYTMTEAGVGSTALSLYAATIGCVDANGLQTGLPAPGTGYDPATGFSLTPVAAAAITCTITNTAIPASTPTPTPTTSSASPTPTPTPTASSATPTPTTSSATPTPTTSSATSTPTTSSTTPTSTGAAATSADPGTTSATAGSASSGLASTGTDLERQLVLTSLLIGAGSILALARPWRRRRSH